MLTKGHLLVSNVIKFEIRVPICQSKNFLISQPNSVYHAIWAPNWLIQYFRCSLFVFTNVLYSLKSLKKYSTVE